MAAPGVTAARLRLANTVAATAFLIGGSLFALGGGELPERWRWWSREPRRLQWLSAVVLFTGTLVFAINLVDSFIEGLSPGAEDRLVWSPDMIGCALFIVSGHLAMAGISDGFWRVWRRRRDQASAA